MARKQISIVLIAVALFLLCAVLLYLPFVNSLLAVPVSMVLDFFRNFGYVTPSDPMLFMLSKMLALYVIIGIPVLIVVMIMRR